MTTKKDQPKEDEQPNKLKLNKNTLKDLEPPAEKIKGGGKKPAGTGAETLTCKNIC